MRTLHVPVSVSHEILPEFREYERGSTVLINAYLAPRMQHYLQRLADALDAQNTRFQVMQSSGRIISAAVAAREPVRTILSGPAGGVVGATAVARDSGYNRILTFDMGGTSTDVALVDGEAGLSVTKESRVQGLPVAVPMLNIHTVGAGGGSLAHFDRGGALQVGPQSAGADPGPVCYGSGQLPTVTDANLLVGRRDPEHFLGGGMRLDEARARQFLERTRGVLETTEQFAEGIIRVVDAHMEKALRHISIEQGHDPRDFVLLSFGGAGPLHAVALARALRIPKVLVPNLPGALSAYGVLVSDFVRDYSRTIMLGPEDFSIERHFAELTDLGQREMEREGLKAIAQRSLDVRYAGQGYELAVPWSPDFAGQFHLLHEKRYGYSDSHRRLEVVNARLRMIAKTEPVRAVPQTGNERGAEHAVVKTRPIYCDGTWQKGKVYDRDQLPPGTCISGPAVIIEYSATTFLPARSAAQVDGKQNLVIEVEV